MVKFVGRSDLKDFVPISEQLSEWYIFTLYIYYRMDVN